MLIAERGWGCSRGSGDLPSGKVIFFPGLGKHMATGWGAVGSWLWGSHPPPKFASSFCCPPQQGWNITVDLVIGPKGIRQMTSKEAKVRGGGVWCWMGDGGGGLLLNW